MTHACALEFETIPSTKVFGATVAPSHGEVTVIVRLASSDGGWQGEAGKGEGAASVTEGVLEEDD
jgi:hypothetical protein